MLLKSGDKVVVVGNTSGHNFDMNEVVYFIGVNVSGETVFVCTNGQKEGGLYQEDFVLYATSNV